MGSISQKSPWPWLVRLYQTAQHGDAPKTKEPSRRLMLIEVGVKRESGEQLLSSLLDDRVGKGDVNKMGRHPGSP